MCKLMYCIYYYVCMYKIHIYVRCKYQNTRMPFNIVNAKFVNLIDDLNYFFQKPKNLFFRCCFHCILLKMWPLDCYVLSFPM